MVKKSCLFFELWRKVSVGSIALHKVDKGSEAKEMQSITIQISLFAFLESDFRRHNRKINVTKPVSSSKDHLRFTTSVMMLLKMHHAQAPLIICYDESGDTASSSYSECQGVQSKDVIIF